MQRRALEARQSRCVAVSPVGYGYRSQPRPFCGDCFKLFNFFKKVHAVDLFDFGIVSLQMQQVKVLLQASQEATEAEVRSMEIQGVAHDVPVPRWEKLNDQILL